VDCLKNIIFILVERVFLVDFYFRERQYTEGVREQFPRPKNPETTVPSRHTMRALIVKFHETGSVCDIKRSRRSSVLTEDKLLNITDSMMQIPSKSIRKLAPQHHIAVGKAHVAVRRKLNLSPYKVIAVQELKQTDNEKRTHYCGLPDHLV
jgi:hypothetical protein